MQYQQLITRNQPILSKLIQKKIFQSRILLAGCGLGSGIGALCARTGFTNFVLIDGDSVEVSNINRQEFESSDVGENKAVALRRRIKRINPDAVIAIIPERIRSIRPVVDLLPDCDYIVNTFDFSKVFLDLCVQSCALDKTVIVPFNILRGSALLIFSKKSQSPQDFFAKISRYNNNNRELYSFLLERYSREIRKHRSELSKLIENKKVSQLGIASNISAALVVNDIIDIIQGRRIPLAPQPHVLFLK